MKTEVQRQLEELRTDYGRESGHPFEHFFCPILFRDEDSELCKAHIVNQAFRNSSTAWTVQRRDIDNFYGTHFEADFVDYQYVDMEKGYAPDVVADKTLLRKFDPKLRVGGKPIEFYIANGDVPHHFTLLRFEDDTRTIDLVLKMAPEDAANLVGEDGEIEVRKDMGIPALVSLIKAAHLTLFKMQGYRYALTAAGRFVGRDILGEFFLQNRDKPKVEVLASAEAFFAEFVHMVRQVQPDSLDLQGTITDNSLLICGGKAASPWAHIVFVKTSRHLSAVLMPIMRTPETRARFMAFLKDDTELIEAKLARLEENNWREVDETPITVPWPKNYEGCFHEE